MRWGYTRFGGMSNHRQIRSRITAFALLPPLQALSLRRSHINQPMSFCFVKQPSWGARSSPPQVEFCIEASTFSCSSKSSSDENDDSRSRDSPRLCAHGEETTRAHAHKSKISKRAKQKRVKTPRWMDGTRTCTAAPGPPRGRSYRSADCRGGVPAKTGSRKAQGQRRCRCRRWARGPTGRVDLAAWAFRVRPSSHRPSDAWLR